MDAAAHEQAARRAGIAREALRDCLLCPRNCRVDRTAGEKGYCQLDDKVRCFREVLRYDEEKGLNPSHQIYFAGCNLKCEFCTVSEWNERPDAADELDVEKLAATIARRKKEGARTLNLLGGEPAVNVHGILELLARVDSEAVVVWNTNMYYNDIVDELVTGLVDIYLADLKCGNSDCAQRLLGAGDYVEVAKANILRAAGHSDVILRYLVLPGHLRCCLEPIVKWVAAELPDVKLSLRDYYVPPAQVKEAPAEYLGRDEYRQAVELAASKGLTLIE